MKIINPLTLSRLSRVIITPRLNTDHSWSGEARNKFVDESSVGLFLPLCIASDGKLKIADADSSDSMPARYVSIGTSAGIGTKLVLFRGSLRDDSWAWSPGGTMYVDSGGGFTQTPPSGGGYIQSVGWADSSNVICFEPELSFWKTSV